ncbi:MAG: carbamate kinase [Candidatus Micrarchaeia archaeon]
MKRQIYVISIGGNALSTEPSALNSVMKAIYKLSHMGDVVITHGNGPQVGELAKVERKPLALLTAQTEAEIGVYLSDKISEYFHRKRKKAVVDTVITRVLVDEKDPSFKNPSKPIGSFYSAGKARDLAKKGMALKRLIGGYRIVVPSPKPVRIINIEEIAYLASMQHIVIAAGGGGIPVFRNYRLANGVIDKDYATSLLAAQIRAKKMFILTNVDGAYLDFGTSKQKRIGRITANEMIGYVRKGFFEDGSMKPKVEACIDFVRHTKGSAVIGNMSNAENVIAMRGCTIISR